METNAIKENYKEVVSHFKSKLKLPIVLTYSIILILYNWDIIYYLTFQKSDTLIKIKYIQNIDNDWYHRILCPILISVFYALLFPILQVGINYIFSWFKNKNNELERKEDLVNAKHRFNIQKEISGSQELETLNNQIKSLMIEKDNLNNQISIVNQQNQALSKENIKINQENIEQTLILNDEISNLKKLNEKLEKEGLKTHLANNKDKIALLLPKEKIIQNKVEEIIKDYNSSFSDEQKVVFVDIIKHLEVQQKDFEFGLSKITLFSKEIRFILNYLEEKSMIKIDTHLGIVTLENLGKEIINILLQNHFK